MNRASTEASYRQGWGEEVALGTYVFVLLAWWREIVIGTALCAVGVGVLIMAMQNLWPKYEASADVAIIRTTTNISIDDKLTTGSSTLLSRRHEMVARRAALVGLVHNGDVAQAVVERLSGRIDEREAKAAILLNRIGAKLITVGALARQNSSDLIRITASADSPEKAAAIANAWGEEYVNHANLLYEQVSSGLIASVNDELELTKIAYSEAQKKLETFISASRVDELSRQISAKQAVVNQWGMALEETLKQSYTLRRKLQWLLDAAHDLRRQVERAGDEGVASNSLALLALKTEAYASLAQLPGTLEIKYDSVDVTHANATDQGADVDALILTMQDRLAQLTPLIIYWSAKLAGRHSPDELILSRGDRTIARMRATGADMSSLPPSESSRLPASQDQSNSTEERLVLLIIELKKEIRQIKAEKELSNAMLLDLTKERDILRSALHTLQNESVELTLKKAALASEVRLASRAVTPVRHTYPTIRWAASLGGAAGLLAMVCFVFLANFLGTRPLLEKRMSA